MSGFFTYIHPILRPMGFLDKLFGGGKRDLNFTSSAELMPENIFWNIILISFNEAAGETICTSIVKRNGCVSASY